MEASYADKPGIVGWFSTVDHKRISRRYIITAFIFLILGGVEAALMRIQLARPEMNFLSPETYNQIFSTHGTTMMFLFAVPVMEAMGLYFVPLMVGAHNVAFPRLNALGYYTYLFGGMLLYGALLFNNAPNAGWFEYVPLSGPMFSPGRGPDVWAQTVTFTEISAIIGAVELIVTILRTRAPGMRLDRMPLFVWAMLVTAFMIVFAMSTVATASMMLAADRLVDTNFFNTQYGGDSLLWQHLFWYFGHPEVYIIFIPALGMVSSMVATFSKRPVFGYHAMVLAMVSIGFLGFGLWVHHMFATNLPHLGSSFFTAASMMIAIPSGVQIFCWLATIWSGRPRSTVPMLYVIGFVILFVIGGLTGVMVASVPLDLQVHDTYFVVAHFHYVLIGGAVFPLLGAIHYWFPKFTGRMMRESWGRIEFALLFTGVNLTFFPMHFLGMHGMTRRIYTYLAETGWGDLNLLASIGAVVIVSGGVLFLANVIHSGRRGDLAPADPWGGETLEWLAASPPRPYNFPHIPVVEGRSALWDMSDPAPVVTGLDPAKKEVIVTTTLAAEPDHKHEHPHPTIFPFLTALAIAATFIGLIFHPWALPIGLLLMGLPLIGWGMPRKAGSPERKGHA